MSGDLRANLKKWLESGEIRLQPLTYPQRELWESSPVPVEDVANHICTFIHLKGRVSHDEVRLAVQRVVDRHEVLRLSFLPGKEQAMPMIRATGAAVISFEDLPKDLCSDEAMEEVMLKTYERPFDLLRGPLHRLHVLQRGPDEMVLVFAIHHAIADGWSLGVLVEDLVAAYLLDKKGPGGPLPPVPMTYGDWGAAERAFWQPGEIARHADFWRETLKAPTRLWQRPSDISARSGKLKRWATAIPADLTQRIRELSKQAGATLFNTLLAAFQIILAEWTGKDDIVVGTPVANRNRQAARETMGYFAGVVPLRGQVDHCLSFPEAARRVQDRTIDAFAHAIPFAELMRVLGLRLEPGHNPIFDVRFALQNHPVPDVEMPGLSFKLRMRSTGTARFDLACEITEDGAELEVVWLYRESLFSIDDVKKLNHRYQALLNSVSLPSESPAAIPQA